MIMDILSCVLSLYLLPDSPTALQLGETYSPRIVKIYQYIVEFLCKPGCSIWLQIGTVIVV